MVSKERLEANFAVMKEFSDKGDGITRLAFSDSDWQARDFIKAKMKEAGLSVREDAFGNVIGCRAGVKDDLPPVALGSHIDSVPNGGNYDGVAGVLAALEVIYAMNDAGFKNEHPVEVIVFMAEESSRFGMATIGSKVITGQITASKLHELKDKSGVSLYDVLKKRGLRPDDIESAKIGSKIKAFLELHIEQGKVLEQKSVQIGVVTGIAAPTRMKVKVSGHADHSGATPMGMRADALCAAAEMVLVVESLAAGTEKPCVGTVGMMDVKPSVLNVVPGEAVIGIDLRSIYAGEKAGLSGAVKIAIEDIAKKRGVKVEMTMLADDAPVELDDKVIDLLADVCGKQNISYMKMPSGAGHDAMHMALVCPTGMLFVPCKDGVSHHKDEYAELSDIEAAIRALYEAVCRLTKEETAV